jgi:4-alpha-glucanotransferase
VVYTGTHDNATTREWFENLPERERQRLWSLVGRPEGEIRDAAPELIRLAWSSPAGLAIAPLQDVLNLGREGRMNVPGLVKGNWRWRATRHMLSPHNFEWLKDLTRILNRAQPVAAMGFAS